MVHFLTLPEGSGHLSHFTRHFGRRAARHMTEWTYGAFLGQKSAPAGVYIFADRDRMNPLQHSIACRLWDALAAHGDRVRLLNDPHRQLGRYEFLAEMYRQGVNRFRAFRLGELPEPLPFPVFVRRENDHHGPRSALLENHAQLRTALAALALEGIAPEEILVCQFQETAEADGVYRKYGAFRVGEAVFGQFLILEPRWEKSHGERIRTEAARDENRRYFETNPHADLLRPYFDVAGVEYGRMDYAFADGRIQVWEVNDNPFLAAPVLAHYIAETGVSKYRDAIESLLAGRTYQGSIELDFEWGIGAEAAFG